LVGHNTTHYTPPPITRWHKIAHFFFEIVVVVLDDIKELSEMQQAGHEGGPKVEAYSLEVFFFPLFKNYSLKLIVVFSVFFSWTLADSQRKRTR